MFSRSVSKYIPRRSMQANALAPDKSPSSLSFDGDSPGSEFLLQASLSLVNLVAQIEYLLLRLRRILGHLVG